MGVERLLCVIPVTCLLNRTGRCLTLKQSHPRGSRQMNPWTCAIRSWLPSAVSLARKSRVTLLTRESSWSPWLSREDAQFFGSTIASFSHLRA